VKFFNIKGLITLLLKECTKSKASKIQEKNLQQTLICISKDNNLNAQKKRRK